MSMRDYEVFEADLFALTGLSAAREEDRVAVAEEFVRLMGMTGIILAGEQLSEKDQGTFGRLLQQEETERATAFLLSRDIDLQEIITRETIRIKRAVIESGRQMESAFDLLLAIKAQLPAMVLAADAGELHSAITEVVEYLETLPISDEQKEQLAENVERGATLRVMEEMSDLVPSDVIDRVNQLMDEDKIGEAFQLMLSHGLDYAQVMAEETRLELHSLKERVSSLGDILSGTKRG